MINESDIIDKLYTLLTAVSGVNVVYKGIPASIEEYPAITILPLSWEDEFADLRDTTVNMVFQINIYNQLSTDTLVAQNTLRELVASIREVLGSDDNITLNGLVDSSRLTSGQYLLDQKESDLYYCSINYNVRKRFNRY